MTVEGQEGQHDQQREQLSQRRSTARAAVLRIDVEGEGQAHAVRQQLAAQGHGVEDQLQAEAECDADEHLLHGDRARRRRERRDRPAARAAAARSSARQRPQAPRAPVAARRARRTAGATMKQEPMRTNGQNSCASQCVELTCG